MSLTKPLRTTSQEGMLPKANEMNRSHLPALQTEAVVVDIAGSKIVDVLDGTALTPKPDGAICRLCQTGEDPHLLIKPCRCVGHNQYVHRDCLDQQRAFNENNQAFMHCRDCEYRYWIDIREHYEVDKKCCNGIRNPLSHDKKCSPQRIWEFRGLVARDTMVIFIFIQGIIALFAGAVERFDSCESIQGCGQECNDFTYESIHYGYVCGAGVQLDNSSNYTCSAGANCNWNDFIGPDKWTAENKQDWGYLSETSISLEACQSLCDARSSCVGIEHTSDYCTYWKANTCSSSHSSWQHQDGPTTCFKKKGTIFGGELLNNMSVLKMNQYYKTTYYFLGLMFFLATLGTVGCLHSCCWLCEGDNKNKGVDGYTNSCVDQYTCYYCFYTDRSCCCYGSNYRHARYQPIGVGYYGGSSNSCDCCDGCACSGGSGGNCDCKNSGGGSGEGAAVLGVIALIVLVILIIIGFIYGLILITLIMTKMVQKHYALAQRRTMTRNYVVRDLDGVVLPSIEEDASSLPCAPPINEVELRAFGLL